MMRYTWLHKMAGSVWYLVNELLRCLVGEGLMGTDGAIS